MRDIAVPLSQRFVCRCLRDAILSRHINAFEKYVLGFLKCSVQRVCVVMVQVLSLSLGVVRGLAMPQGTDTYYCRPTHNEMKAVSWF